MKITVVIADDSKMMLDRLQQLFTDMEQVEVVGRSVIELMLSLPFRS